MICKPLIISETPSTGTTKYQSWCPACKWESDLFDFKWQAERAREKHTGTEPETHPPWARGPGKADRR